MAGKIITAVALGRAELAWSSLRGSADRLEPFGAQLRWTSTTNVPLVVTNSTEKTSAAMASAPVARRRIHGSGGVTWALCGGKLPGATRGDQLGRTIRSETRAELSDCRAKRRFSIRAASVQAM